MTSAPAIEKKLVQKLVYTKQWPLYVLTCVVAAQTSLQDSVRIVWYLVHYYIYVQVTIYYLVIEKIDGNAIL